MALFGIGKTNAYLGIDVGAAGVKLVEFREEKGRAKLHTYAYTARGPEELSASLLDDVAGTSVVIKAMIKKSKATAVKAVTGLPISSVFSSVLSVPKLADKEQKGAIEVQARKIISIPLEELVLDSKVITPPELLKVKGPDALLPLEAASLHDRCSVDLAKRVELTVKEDMNRLFPTRAPARVFVESNQTVAGNGGAGARRGQLHAAARAFPETAQKLRAQTAHHN